MRKRYRVFILDRDDWKQLVLVVKDSVLVRKISDWNGDVDCSDSWRLISEDQVDI